MAEERASNKLSDGLVTTGGVWLALILAGLATFWLRPGLAASLLSLAAYIALLALYGCVAPPGRRSKLPSYLVAGILYPVMAIAVMIAVLPSAASEWIAWPAIGLRVGFEFQGGADTPAGAYLPSLWLNILIPIVVVIGARSFFRFRRPT